jgi:hypothetical protein
MGAESFQKRERERKRKARAAERRERRDNKAEPEEETEPVDTDALMEQFRVLSERHNSGEIDAETYEAERTAIFELLGLM